MTVVPAITEVLTGRMRPRHRRFHDAFANLCGELGLDCQLRPVALKQRLLVQAAMRWQGVRSLKLDTNNRVGVLHQALNRGSMPYLAEFDVPLALHGYDIVRHRRTHGEARRLLEQPQLRALLTFSNWAGRSFGLHFGPEVEAKCRTVYPLAFEAARCGSFVQRKYDFSFIATQFWIKCGPETVRAFCQARADTRLDARICVVTRLEQAREVLGDLSQYPGIEWREAVLSEAEIAVLLEETKCLVHPSLSDSFGVVVLEALAAGCAVIASDMASFPELVQPERNGWLLSLPTSAVVGDTYITEYGTVPYHEAYLNTMSLHSVEAALRETMGILLRDQQRLQEMMKASHALYEARFSPLAWRERMRNILKESFPELTIGEA
jgi:hypothetical protein